jgi:hypothetical protein
MEGMCNYLAPVTTVRSFALRHVFPARDKTVPVAWREATIVLAIFLAAQVADGVLTYWGVTTLGIHVEGNDLLAATMRAFGPFPALVSAKLLALAIMAGLYIGVAVTPWLLVMGGVLVESY